VRRITDRIHPAGIRARLLEEAVAAVREELMLVDPAELIAFIRTENFANVNDIVASSAELHFRASCLTFGLGADYSLGWCEPPQVRLDMEFVHGPVSIFFTLVLGDAAEPVEINKVLIEHPSADPSLNTERIRAELAAARLDQ
jgi:hypothetical protein